MATDDDRPAANDGPAEEWRQEALSRIGEAIETIRSIPDADVQEALRGVRSAVRRLIVAVEKSR
jgi:hypothetical protein